MQFIGFYNLVLFFNTQYTGQPDLLFTKLGCAAFCFSSGFSVFPLILRYT